MMPTVSPAPSTASGLRPHGPAVERRGSRRHRVAVRVEYSREGEVRRGSVFDLGAGGVFICSAAPLDLGAVVDLSILTPGEHGVVRGVGRVVWTNLVNTSAVPAGMGVRFTHIDPGALRHLGRHLEALP